MDRNIAKEKIEKLLRLANNSGATEGEKATALDMAKKLSEKYGFKIIKASPVEEYTQPHVYQPASNTLHTIIVSKSNFLGYNPDFVEAILIGMGYKCRATSNYFVVGSYGKFDVEGFHNAYKQNKVRVVFRDLVNEGKTHSWWGKNHTSWAKSSYSSGLRDGASGSSYNTGNKFYAAGYEVGSKFCGLKFDV